jgi:hypothetical protein
MYKPGVGYVFSPAEKKRFETVNRHMGRVMVDMSSYPVGEKQRVVAALLQAIAPIFSEGELSMAVRMSQTVELAPAKPFWED